MRYGEYEKFLDRELNAAYALLMSKLPMTQQAQLRAAQRQWLEYRDAEFALIAANWTPQTFGRSAALSRGAHRAGVIDSRITTALVFE
jgi:uncharacterized protein YecT (DUF1311 family)